MAVRKELVALLQFPGKNLLEFEGVLEYKDGVYPQDVIFVSIYKDFKREQAFRVQLRSLSVRELSESLRELLGLKIMEGSYTKTTQSGTKILWRAKEKERIIEQGKERIYFTYFLNIIKGSELLSVSFDLYGARALLRQLDLFCDRMETALYRMQAAVQHSKGGV